MDNDFIDREDIIRDYILGTTDLDVNDIKLQLIDTNAFDSQAWLYKNVCNGEYYLICDPKNEDKVMKDIHIAEMKHLTETKGFDKIHSLLNNNKVRLFAGDYCKVPGLQGNEQQKDAENEIFKGYLMHKFGEYTGIKPDEKYSRIFKDKLQQELYNYELAVKHHMRYGLNMDYMPDSMTVRWDVPELLDYLRDYDKADIGELCEQIANKVINQCSDKTYGHFYNYIDGNDSSYLSCLIKEGKIAIDYNDVEMDISELTHGLGFNLESTVAFTTTDKGEFFIHELSQKEIDAYKYHVLHKDSVYQNWYMGMDFSLDKDLSGEDIENLIRNACKKDGIEIMTLTVHTPDEYVREDSPYQIYIKARHKVEYYEDRSVGIDGEFEGMFENSEDIADWLRETLGITDKGLAVSTYAGCDSYDDIYKRYEDKNMKRMEEEEKYQEALMNENDMER